MLTQFEFFILNSIQSIRFELLDRLMVAITALGNGGAIWIAMGIAMLFFKKSRKTGIAVLIGLLLGLILGNLTIKNLVARPRPCSVNTDISLLIPFPSEYSFPSGHTLSSFVSAVGIYLWNKKLGSWAIALASLIAFSRLYLYVHFPTDILGGIVLGTALAHLSSWITKKIATKRL